ncbi:hypothetical protein [Streptomyces chartreusis]|uniref:hypothetical protein n=1 Tax=Streptomyces chartreusis TaxID=1969 RepID=UPI0036683AC9
MDWTKHTAVLAALVAAVGLALSAWGTLKSAQIANDQLAQSRDAKAAEDRAQAERVTRWRESDWFVVANRSNDPVSVYLWFYFGGEAPNFDDLGDKNGVYFQMPPCQSAKVHIAALDQYLRSGSNAYSFDPDDSGVEEAGDVIWYESMNIVDAHGHMWERLRDGRLIGPSPSQDIDHERLVSRGPSMLEFLKAKVQRLNCDVSP